MATGTSRTVYYTPSGGSKTNVGSYHQSSTMSIANATGYTVTAKAVLRTSSGSTESTTGGVVSPTTTTFTSNNSVITWDINAVCTVLSSISAAKNYPFTGSISWTKAGTSQTAISYTGSTGSMSPGTSAVTKDIATKSATVAKTTSSQAISATISMNINTSGNYSGSGNSSVSLSGTIPAKPDNSVTLRATPKSAYAFLGWATSATATTYLSTTTSYTVSNVAADATYYAIFTAARNIGFYSGIHMHKTDVRIQIYGDGTYRTITFPTAESIDGWTFIGWHGTTSATSSPTYSSDVTSAAPTTYMTFYAVYSRTSTITYANGGGTGTAPTNSTGTQYYNSYSTGSASTVTFTLRANTFTRSGYTFNGWDIGAANSSYSWAPAVDESATKTATAQWLQNIVVTATSGNATYDGATHKAKVSVNVAGATVEYGTSTSYGYSLTATNANTAYELSSVSATNVADSKTVYYRVSKSGCVTATGSTTITISQKEVTLTWGTTSWVYDGNTHSTTCTAGNLVSGDTCTVTLSNNSVGANVGSVTVTASSLSNSNYKLPSAKTKTISVTAASSSFTLSPTSLTLTYPTAGTSTFSGTNCSINGVSSSNTNVATVSKSGNTITVTPVAVGTATITVTGTAASTNYSAPANKTISVTVNRGTQTVNLSATSGTITYPATTLTFTASTTGNGALSVSPTSGNSVANASISNGTVTVTKAGYGTVTITVTAAQTNQYNSASKTYSVTVAKAAGTLTLTAKTGLVYTGSSQTLTTYSGNSGTVTYDTTYVNSGTDAGTYTVKATSAESTNYYAVTKQTSVTISAANQAPTVTAIANLKYAGTAQTLATLGGTHPGTMHYRLGTSGSWSTTMPTATNAGSYTVYWYADVVANSASSTTNYTKATNNYNAYSNSSSPSSTACSIGKADNPMIWYSTTYTSKWYASTFSSTVSAAWDAQGTVTYSLVSQVNSSDAAVTYFSFNASTRVLSAAASVAPIDVYRVTLRATAAGNDNYNSKTLDYTYVITVYRNSVGNKPTTSVSKTYTGSEQTNGYTTPTGVTMSGNNKGTTVGTYTATYTPNYGYCWSDETYDAVSVTLTIGNANLTVSAPNQSYTYNGSAQGSAITVTSVGSQTVTIKYGTTSGTYNLTSAPQITNVADSKTIYYQATAANHNTATGSYTLTINKRTVTPTAPTLTTGTLTYNGSPKTLANAGSCTAGGTMYYYVGTSSTAPTFSTSTYSTSISTKTDAGTYYIFWYCYVSDTANNNDTTSDNINVVKSLGSRVIGQADNSIAVTATQSISANYNVSNQDKSFTAATGAQGTVTYAIQSQKNSGGTTVTSFSIPTNTSATLRVAALTTAGTYTVVVRATAAGNSNYKSGYKDITITVTVTSYTVTMTKGTGISSVTYKLGTGSATTYSSTVTVPVGQTVTYGATASSGYTWWKWTGTHTSTTNAYSFTMSTSNVSDTANAMQQITTPSWKGTLTYNGNSQSATTTTLWNNYNTSTSTIGGTTSGINAGSYNATFTPKSGYCWTDGTTSAKTVSWSIGTKSITITGASASKIYDKTALTSNSASLTSGSLVSGHTATYSASGTITNVGSVNNVPSVVIKSGSTDVTSNYGVTKVNGTLTITAREVTLTWGTTSWTYDGNTHSTTCTAGNLVSGDTCTVTLTGNSVGANVGSATVTASSLSNSNYKLPSANTKTISVTRKSVGAKPTTSISKLYNMAEQTNNYTTPSNVTMTGSNKGTNVGTYSATYTPNSNYCWSDNSYSAVTVTLTIWAPCVYVKQSNAWKQSIPIIKVNGAWKVPNAVYVNVNGTWKQVIKM